MNIVRSYRGIQTCPLSRNERRIHPVKIRVTFRQVLSIGLAVVVNQPPVRAELNRVPPLGPRNIVNEVLYRNVGQDGGGQSDGVTQSAEAIEWLII